MNWARAWKTIAKKKRWQAEVFWSGGLACVECERPTNNGICTECRHGVSPYRKLKTTHAILLATLKDVFHPWCADRPDGPDARACKDPRCLRIREVVEIVNKEMTK